MLTSSDGECWQLPAFCRGSFLSLLLRTASEDVAVRRQSILSPAGAEGRLLLTRCGTRWAKLQSRSSRGFPLLFPLGMAKAG